MADERGLTVYAILTGPLVASAENAETAREGGAPQAVLAEIKHLEAAISDKVNQLAGITAKPPTELDLRRLKKAAHERIARFKDLLYSDVPLARQALRKLLLEPITFAPQGEKGFVISGKLSAGPIFSVGLAVASPWGFELNSGPVLVVSYGTLPRRAKRRVLARV